MLNDPMIRTTALLDILLDKATALETLLATISKNEVPEGNLNTLRALLTEIRFDLGFQVTTVIRTKAYCERYDYAVSQILSSLMNKAAA